MNTHQRRRIRFCRGWRFLRVESPGDPDYSSPDLRDEAWDSVSLPHTPRLEAASVQFPFQGLCWYRKTIHADREWSGKRITLEFGAGMQIADVWVNGRHRLNHLGGYLPFSVDLSETLGAGYDAQISVRLDNRDTDLCPPGKPQAELDFCYFGGLYREAQLLITNDLHISDPVRAACPAGGGIFIRCEEASESHAILHLTAHALNETPHPARRCLVVFEIVSPEGHLLQQIESFPVMIGAGEGHHFIKEVQLKDPALWHPDSPKLHRLVTRLFSGGAELDQVETRFGVRHLSVSRRFSLNGKEFHLRGANRHQEHPCIGNALPPHAHRRDARRIKDAGFNFVRLSHYPQDPSFLDACDELGLLVQAAVPGWQQFWMNPSFIRQSFQDIRDLVRRDRNHPSVIFWEPNLNETGEGEHGEGHSDWCRAAHEITHQEYPGNQCFTFGDDYPAKPGWNWDVQGFWREYGDFAFGGNESTSRQTRADGEAAMLQQAWNFLWTFNHLNARFSDSQAVYLGCAVWVMFDYNRGYYPKPCTCGMMDIFRLPKYVHYLYQSQRDPKLLRDDVASGPMVFLATDWTPREGLTKVVVFSNCDEVELKLNGRLIARRRPDDGPDTPYSPRREPGLNTVGDNYDRSGGTPFDGGNATHIPHPPFTFFDIAYEPGQLEAIGYLDGNSAATHRIATPGEPHRLELSIDLAGVPLAADSLDAVFVHARVLDKDGNLTPKAELEIAFEIEGPGEFLGSNPVTTHAGIASVLLKTDGSAEKTQIRAYCLGPKGINLPSPIPTRAVQLSGLVFKSDNRQPLFTSQIR
jgi:beta-galactosidase